MSDDPKASAERRRAARVDTAHALIGTSPALDPKARQTVRTMLNTFTEALQDPRPR